jgi:hypothetical protein
MTDRQLSQNAVIAAISVVGCQRLENLGIREDDAAYNQALEHAIAAVKALPEVSFRPTVENYLKKRVAELEAELLSRNFAFDILMQQSDEFARTMNQKTDRILALVKNHFPDSPPEANDGQ